MKNESQFLELKSFIAEEAPLEIHEGLALVSNPFLSLHETADDMSDSQSENIIVSLC